jgi:uridylate kinase
MDAAAFSLCMENEIPIIVFDFFKTNGMVDIFNGDTSGTLVTRG